MTRFGWLMIAFGVAQSVTNFRIQSASHLTLPLSGTAGAVIVSGFLNVSRARQSDGFTQAFSVIGNPLIEKVSAFLRHVASDAVTWAHLGAALTDG